MSNYKGIEVIPEGHFNEWFKKLDQDGDGKIDMIEMAHGITNLTTNMPAI
jgi:Ca2+-binding EF-hand superfamily protein